MNMGITYRVKISDIFITVNLDCRARQVKVHIMIIPLNRMQILDPSSIIMKMDYMMNSGISGL